MARFRKGQSGNPGGRPRSYGDLRELARAHTQTALDTLIRVMQDESAPASARVSAAAHLLDRGHGRPELRGRIEHSISDLGERLLRAEQRRRLAKELPAAIIEAGAER